MNVLDGRAGPHPGLRRDLGVIHVRVIAALAADELKRLGVAAFYPALHDAGRPAPQGRCAAVGWLTRRREGCQTLIVRSA
jgi:hypothetical protein